MASAPELQSPAAAPHPRWQSTVGWAAWGSLLLILGPVLAGALYVAASEQPLNGLIVLLAGVAFLSPIWLPYVFVLIRLHGPKPTKGLGLSISIAAVWALLAVGAAILSKDFWPAAAYFGVFAALQVLLGGLAIKAYLSRTPAAGDRRTLFSSLAAGAVYGIVLGAILGVAIPNLLRTRMDHDHGVSPVSSLRTINTAAVTYDATYNNGFPPSLAALTSPPAEEPNCNAAGLIDPLLASGRKSAYVFIYLPGPRVEKPGPGCATPGALTYTVVARPVESGKRSFFTDESGVIRYTSENRPATAHDPALD